MDPQLYLPEMDKDYFKNQIGRFVEVYNLKLNAVFDDMNKEANEHGNSFFNQAMRHYYPDYQIDTSYIAEEAMNRSVEHWDLLNHGRYVLLASWHVALYEAFEQQVRLFLIKEISHDYRFKNGIFVSRLKDFKTIFALYGVNLNSVKGLKQIDQLRLLCNVIKHGEGTSADDLRKKRPELIKVIENTELLDLYGSSLLDESLAISVGTLMEFGNAIEDFWDSFPERSFCKNTEKLLRFLNKK